MIFSANSLAGVKAYFNNDPEYSYKDPYRKKIKQGQNLEKIIIDKILSAKKSIYIAVQELRLPNIAKALVKKHKDGIDVRIILENEYNNSILKLRTTSDDEQNDHSFAKYKSLFNFIDKNSNGVTSKAELLDRDAIYILNKGKVSIKDDTFDDSFGSGIMHHKFIVIDDSEVIASTANFTLSGVHGDYDKVQSIGNANSLLAIESKKMARLFMEEFMIMWGSDQKKSLFGMNKPYRKAKRVVVGDTIFKVQFSPVSSMTSWKDSVNGLIGKEIAKSNHSINMALFVFSDQMIANQLKLKQKQKSSFDIKLLVEPKFAYRNYSELLDLWGLELFDENCRIEPLNRPWHSSPIDIGGVPSLNYGDVLHHKFAVVDNQSVIVGSQNWSYSANYSNDEFLIVIENSNIADQFNREFDRLLKDSRIGPPAHLIQKIESMDTACRKNKTEL